MTGHPANALVERCGPFYDTDGLTTWLGLPRQQVHERREARTLLGCPTAEGELIYPVWQFQDNGELLPGLPSVLMVLSSESMTAGRGHCGVRHLSRVSWMARR